MRRGENRSVLPIINSQSGQTEISLARIREIFSGHDIDLIEHVPDDVSAIPDFIRANASRVDVIIIGGGDDTISLSLDALRKMHPLMIIVWMFLPLDPRICWSWDR